MLSLLADTDGNLWIGTVSGLDRLNKEGFYHYPDSASYINAIRRGADGKIWIVRSRLDMTESPVCEAGAKTLRCYGAKDGIPFRHAELLDISNANDLLIASGNTILKWNRGMSKTYVPDSVRKEKNFNGLRALLVETNQSFIVGMAIAGPGRGLQRYAEGPWQDALPNSVGSSLKIATLFRDREHSLWIGTNNDGLLRVSAKGIERFRDTDGLTGNAVQSILEDSEGNIWIATSKGLDCFRHLAVTTYSMKEGLLEESVESVLASKHGGVWIGNSGGLAHLDGNRITTIGHNEGFPGQRVTSLFEDQEGELWVGIDGDLYLFRNGKFIRAQRKVGETGVVVRITETDEHALFVLTTGPPNRLSRVNKSSMAIEEIHLPGSPRLIDIDAVPGQGLYLNLLGSGAPTLAAYVNGKIIPLIDGKNQVRALLGHSGDGAVWGSASRMIFRWKNGKAAWLSRTNGLPCDQYYSTTQDYEGNIWLYTVCGLIKIEKREVELWADNPARNVAFQILEAPSGALPAFGSFTPSATQAANGTLYFANGNVLQTIDPKGTLPYTKPPPVHIEEVHVNHQSLPIAQWALLSPVPRDLEFVYTGLCLSLPLKVNFRYKLEGFDREWQDAGTRRQAFYTELGPGRYRFRVIAQGATGLWNDVGDSLDFVVPPAWYQRQIFLLACVALGMILIVAAYRFRVRKIQAATQHLYDERLAERTRIARDIHDTLLQTLQGSKIVAEDALERVDDEEHLKRALQNLSDFLTRAMNEGRAALQSLRESTKETSNLAEAFKEAIAECKLRENMSVVFTVDGNPRPLHPIARDEVYRIGYEAIKNACAHSEAKVLEVTLTYGSNLILRIKDDGKGIGEECLEIGRKGHFGLGGMRERAQRIQAQLEISTRPNAGTEVVLKVPENAIFDERSLLLRLLNSLRLR